MGVIIFIIVLFLLIPIVGGYIQAGKEMRNETLVQQKPVVLEPFDVKFLRERNEMKEKGKR